MKPTSNSRRNFLGTLAILTSGTVVAGSPLSLLDTGNKPMGDASLQKSWNEVIKNNGASGFLNITGTELPHGFSSINGLQHKAGDIVCFGKENILAQPAWIYWGNNRNTPDDVVISFFENSYPYKKIKSINRFELKALAKLGTDKNILQGLCTKNRSTNKAKLNVQTRIRKRKQVQQDIKLYSNNEIVLKEQLFYNV